MQRIVNNIFLRNLAVFILFLSPDILQHIAKHGKVDGAAIASMVYSWSAFFAYFIFHNRVLYEKVVRRRRYLLYVILFVTTLFAWRELTSYLYWLLTRQPAEVTYHIRELKEYNVAFWLFIYWADIVYIYISFGVYLAFRYLNERARLLQVVNVQKEMELKQLNAQLNPHFLFNALNNVYSHLLGGGDAGELVLKLSELMRYILDSSKRQIVPLSEELAFIANYIAFERERLGERCDIDYHTEITAGMFNIVPLILFNFIENAFKHGTTAINRSAISIRIKANNNMLEMCVENDLSEKSVATGTGMGTENTRRRLQLLYEGKHRITVTKTGKKYIVLLQLDNVYEK